MSRRDKRPRCFWCHARGVPLTRDHVVPLSYGGSAGAANVVRACHACNQARNWISAALLNVYKAAAGRPKAQRRAAKRLEVVRPLIPVWAAIERRRFGRSVSDQLGTPAIPFPVGVVGRALDAARLRAARNRAEGRPGTNAEAA